MKTIKFNLTDIHIKLMKRMNVRYDDQCEFGAPIICPKRPYGNSYVYDDIGEIIGLYPTEGDPDDLEFSLEQKVLMMKIHKQMAVALQVALTSQSFDVGLYEAQEYIEDWHKAK
jgi:hypothetical protein